MGRLGRDLDVLAPLREPLGPVGWLLVNSLEQLGEDHDELATRLRALQAAEAARRQPK